MNYSDYLEAAKRHRETCLFLLLRLKNRQDHIDVSLQNKLMHNVYYLSGYIIECIISHTLFRVINYNPKKSVYELDHNNSHGYSFNVIFREHSFKSNYLRIDAIRKHGGSIPSSIPIIGEVECEEILNIMYSEWDAKARYSRSHLTFIIDLNNIEKFFNLADQIYLNLRKI